MAFPAGVPKDLKARWRWEFEPTEPAMLGIVLSLFASSPAAQLFGRNQTGGQLASNPSITFHETGTVAGNALDFTSGTAGANQFLFELPLVLAATRSDLTVFVGIDFTPLSGDNDFIFGLHDGSSINAWERADNGDGQWFAREGAVAGTAVP